MDDVKDEAAGNGPIGDRDLEAGDSKNESLVPEKSEAPAFDKEDAEEEAKVYPSWQKTVLVMVALYLALFLVSLDRTIIATAIPVMTDEFQSFGDIGWYASAYMITACAFQLLFGRIYTFYSPKWVFLSAVGLFELGSLICGVAPDSKSFIVGRAIAGLGSAGIFGGSIVLTVDIVPLHKRPIYQSFMGATFLISSVIGPLIGGAFTTNVTWRWCFYINLPIGGATAILCVLFLKPQSRDKRSNLTIREEIDQLDPIGTICLLAGVVCLLLALQWGGSTYTWNDGRIIALLVLFGLLSIAFVGVQIWKGEKATVPPRIAKNRSVSASAFYAFCISASLMALVYFLPIWFQAIQGVDAIESGIRVLPLILALVVSSIIAGGSVSAIGYFTPFLIACSCIMSVGAGLLSTFTVDSSEAKWIGYQVIYGFGIGLGQQQASLAAQACLADKDVPTGVALKFFGQQLGGAIFVSVAQNILDNKLISGLTGLPGIDPHSIVNMGATNIRGIVGPQFLSAVLVAYNNALTSVFLVVLALAAISLAGALLVEWKSIKGRDLKGA